ncbi:hypothetical protein [Isoptericola hypogeus]|uniref:hypothetical protein n=1 Tax=Isoptericola hypogeus TaxID=300179 RepID=UPI0031D57AF9
MGNVVRRTVRELGVRSGPAAGLLAMLLVVVLGLVAGFLGYRFVGRPVDPAFALAREWGFGEVLFAVMTVWTVGLLVVIAARSRMPVAGVWAGAFAVLLADDRLTLHERYGPRLARRFGVDDASTGELVWLLVVALVVGAVMLVAHFRASPEGRAFSAVLVLLTVALFGIGVVLDWLHGFLENPLAIVVTALEDGGELAVMSVVVAYVFAVAFTGHRPVVDGLLGRLTGASPPARAGREASAAPVG